MNTICHYLLANAFFRISHTCASVFTSSEHCSSFLIIILDIIAVNVCFYCIFFGAHKVIFANGAIAISFSTNVGLLFSIQSDRQKETKNKRMGE